MDDKFKALVKDVELRAEFEFEEVWQTMLRDPLLNVLVKADPRFLKTAKQIMRHGYVAGAQSAVLIIMEMVANDICE
jgi:hypothetical protein